MVCSSLRVSVQAEVSSCQVSAEPSVQFQAVTRVVSTVSGASVLSGAANAAVLIVDDSIVTASTPAIQRLTMFRLVFSENCTNFSVVFLLRTHNVFALLRCGFFRVVFRHFSMQRLSFSVAFSPYNRKTAGPFGTGGFPMEEKALTKERGWIISGKFRAFRRGR